MPKDWEFSHNLATGAKWTPGLREIFVSGFGHQGVDEW